MIAAWILYSALCAIGLSAAAVVAERALITGRGPVRHVWVAAVTLSLIIPLAAFFFARPAPAAITVPVAAVVSPETTSPTSAPPPALAAAHTAPVSPDWRATIAEYDDTIAVLWGILSLTVALGFAGCIIALSWMRRGWAPRTLLGTPVLVSSRTGPAVIGVFSPAIVVPEWALDLDEGQLALMLRHEVEHQRARDGQLLAAAQLALVVMPWNVALWWQTLRLRVAVELDCDARVLRSADPRAYGNLLLEVARPRRGSILIGATAFAERARQLERRITVLGRHRVRTSRGASIVAMCAGLAAITIAWSAPHPAVPFHAPAIRFPRPPLPHASSANNTRAGVVAERDVTMKTTADEKAPVELPAPASVPAEVTSAASPQVISFSPAVDSVFDRLFAGIEVTADQAMKARILLARLTAEQATEDEHFQSSNAINRVQTAVLQAQRDSSLRALLTNDADRATFDMRIAQRAGGGPRSGGPGARGGGPGGRGGGAGRSGTPGTDSLGGGRQGRGGGRGSDPGMRLMNGSVYSVALNGLSDRVVGILGMPARARDDNLFRAIFDGIPLSVQQDADARALIAQFFEKLPPMPLRTLRLRVAPDGIVSMQAPSATALASLLQNDADRATLQSRIMVVQR